MSLVSVQAARADDAAAARFHDERAREHYARGRYEAAIREFFLEQRIAPNPRIVFNIALCFQLLGEDAEAFQMYTEYLADADADEDEDRRRQARDAVEELAPRVSRLRVTSNPPGAEIYVDHEEHGSYGRTPTVIAVSPGEHRVVLTRSLHRSAETTVQADRGQESAVELDLTPITGSLEVTASVDGGATVRTPAGRTVASGDTPLSVDLPPGPYAVAVTAEGWQRDRSLIEV
jgi:hypothetical protein